VVFLKFFALVGHKCWFIQYLVLICLVFWLFGLFLGVSKLFSVCLCCVGRGLGFVFYLVGCSHRVLVIWVVFRGFQTFSKFSIFLFTHFELL
jgi:hypothetical protein